MSDETNVLSKTQIIVVEPTSGSVAVISAGPAGPAGADGTGGGGNTNPIDFLGANTTEAMFKTDPAGGNIRSRILLVADSGSGGIGRVALDANKWASTPQFDGGTLGLYNGDGFNGIFARAFPAENQINLSAATGQTTPLFILYDHDAVNKLLQITPTGAVDLLEQTVPASPAANVGRLYAFDDSGVTKLAVKDSAGTITVLGAGGGGSSLPITDTDSTITVTIPAAATDWRSHMADSAIPDSSAEFGIYNDGYTLYPVMDAYWTGGHASYIRATAGATWAGVDMLANSGASLQGGWQSTATETGFWMNSVSGHAPYFEANSGTPPASPSSQHGRLYFDKPSTKVRLMAKFPSGAAVQIAIEP